MKRVTHSAKETQKLGKQIGEVLDKGDVLLLLGDMGTGKSEITRGIAKGLDIAGAIPSPTFTIMQMYTDGRIPLYHFDWYRLGSSDELYELGMHELLGGDGVAVVEWPSRAIDALPEQYYSITIENGTDENERIFTFEKKGDVRDIWKGDHFEYFGD